MVMFLGGNINLKPSWNILDFFFSQTTNIDIDSTKNSSSLVFRYLYCTLYIYIKFGNLKWKPWRNISEFLSSQTINIDIDPAKNSSSLVCCYSYLMYLYLIAKMKKRLSFILNGLKTEYVSFIFLLLLNWIVGTKDKNPFI